MVPYKRPFNSSKGEEYEGKGEKQHSEKRKRGKLCNLRGDGISKKHRKAKGQLRTDWEASFISKPVPRWCAG